MLNTNVVPGAVVDNLGPWGGRPEDKSEHSKNGWQSGMIERSRALMALLSHWTNPSNRTLPGVLLQEGQEPRVCQHGLSFLLLAARHIANRSRCLSQDQRATAQGTKNYLGEELLWPSPVLPAWWTHPREMEFNDRYPVNMELHLGRRKARTWNFKWKA